MQRPSPESRGEAAGTGGPDALDVHQAVRWSVASVAWTVVAGFVAHSMLLVVFAAVGALDAGGSTVLARHFRHALRHEAISARRERLSLVTITAGMGLIALATTAESVRRLIAADHHTDFSRVGSAVAAASIAALAVLAVGKQRVARRIDSRALLADSHVSAMGAALAACTVAGTAATTAWSWWWLDPVGSLVVAFIAFGVALAHARHA